MDRRGQRGDRERVAARVRDVGCGRSQRVVDAEQVHLERALENGRVAPHEWQLRRCTGVGDHDVEATEPLHGLLHRILDLAAVANVALERRGVVALSCHRRQQVGLEPRKGDHGTPGVKPSGGGGADPSRCAGDEHSSSGQGAHRSGCTRRALRVIASIS